MSHVRKPKLIEQRLQEHASYVITDPSSLRGSWRERFDSAKTSLLGNVTGDAAGDKPASQSRLHVDLGCGKGLWTTRVAAANPASMFLGIDMERMCVSFAAERAGLDQLSNTLFFLDLASNTSASFADDEVDVLHANFPTPFPRLKEAPKRVTDARQLMAYRRILGEDGLFCLKTDSQFMFDFSLDQLEAAGYTILWHTRDLHGEYAGHEFTHEHRINAAGRTELNQLAAAGPLPTDLVESAYERKLIEKGAKVHVVHAVPGPAPTDWEPAEFVSLFDYLPEDLEEIVYSPLGMEDAINNMRNRQRNAKAKAAARAVNLELSR